jgi:MOSC domain-containing protein YiiM
MINAEKQSGILAAQVEIYFGGKVAKEKKSQMMKLLSVNVSRPKEVLFNGQIITTGIFKEPVQGRVMLRTLNLDGDGQGDLSVHGGTDKAIYVYSIENYHYWQQRLGRDDFTYGQFGENFTVEGMLEDQVHIGDVFRVGDALIEVTQPRVPCFKLGLKMDLPQFPKMFLSSGRSGFYLRVLEEGELGAGDVFERVKVGPEQVTVRETHHLLYFDRENPAGAKKVLRIPALSSRWRASFEEIVAKNI